MRVTCVQRIATTTTLATGTTTLASVVPELMQGVDAPYLNRPLSCPLRAANSNRLPVCEYPSRENSPELPFFRYMMILEEKISHPLATGCPPGWASGWGQDEYGIWLAFTVVNIEQRMRWIPPGQFMMGSPATEAGRFDREAQHPVTLKQGFWLFDTPVTQALWQAVMGNNPSYFKSPDRPVERVSWEESRAFIDALNGRMPGLDLQLPTEAQWEYACRAGTATATYAGDLDLKGANNAPVLDDIAWYGGNSGVDFKLSNGYDSSDWPEKQYDHTQAGTHPVASKQANPWGLYDMLGNVYEWCADWWTEDLGSNLVVDPTGPEVGADRVVRGGCWYDVARRRACGVSQPLATLATGTTTLASVVPEFRPGTESGMAAAP